ncbi:MAG: cupin domain-containing protein [Candidatus Latescibacteria bacterium]|nr:cupin domain-containing protein [Candidatus Latescibacterota bacterium]
MMADADAPVVGNLFAKVPAQLPEELFEALLQTPAFTLERIVSRGHRSAPGQWYDQERAEWVLVVQGRARLVFEGGAEVVEMRAGDYVQVPAHCRHRVEWTDPDQETVWLALHY